MNCVRVWREQVYKSYVRTAKGRGMVYIPGIANPSTGYTIFSIPYMSYEVEEAGWTGKADSNNALSAP